MSDNPSRCHQSNMAPFITVAMRKTIVCWCFEQHMTALQISVLAGCSERAVYKVLQLHWDYGQVTNLFTHSRGRRILDNGDVMAILKRVGKVGPLVFNAPSVNYAIRHQF